VVAARSAPPSVRAGVTAAAVRAGSPAVTTLWGHRTPAECDATDAEWMRASGHAGRGGGEKEEEAEEEDDDEASEGSDCSTVDEDEDME